MNPGGRVFPAIRWHGRSPRDLWPEVRASLSLGVGGFVAFGGSLQDMWSLARRARAEAGRPLLFAADLERGAGQQMEGATPLPPAAALAVLGDDALREAASITAREAAAAGIGWVLAPVADLDVQPANPIIGVRSFGAAPARVAAAVAAWVEAAQREGIQACAKHFPGHGRTTTDSHAGLPVVAADPETLDADLEPFRAAIQADVGSVMLAHVAYPGLDASGAPAGFSAPILGCLRDALGFRGVTVTDALIMDAVSAAGLEGPAAAVAAAAAGTDALLYPSDASRTLRALADALEARELSADRMAESLERLEALAAAVPPPPESPPAIPPSNRVRARELAAASVTVLRGETPRRGRYRQIRVAIVDDDLEATVGRPDFAAPGAGSADRSALARALAEQGLEVDLVADALSAPRRAPEPVDVLAVFCDVRGWKRRAGLAPATAATVAGWIQRAPAATVLLFAHPRLADGLPGEGPVLCAWCGDPLMQEAAAARLAGAAA